MDKTVAYPALKKTVTIVEQAKDPEAKRKESTNMADIDLGAVMSMKTKMHVQIPFKHSINNEDLLIDSSRDKPKFDVKKIVTAIQPMQKRSQSIQLQKQQSVQILRQHKNLNLDTYKPFIKDFHHFSNGFYQYESNIFQPMVKDSSEVLKAQLQRSEEKEFSIVVNNIKQKEGKAADLSPLRMQKILKRLPPFQNDTIPEIEIEEFQKKGSLGWSYLTS